MPNDRPQNAEALAKKRPFLAEDYSACGIILVIPTPELFRADSTSCTDCPKNAVHTKSTGGIIRPPSNAIGSQSDSPVPVGITF